MMQEPLGPSHIEGLKEQLERLKQTFHAEQLRMRRKFTSHNEQLKACTQSLQSLHVSCATDGSYLNDTQASQLSFNADASRPAAAQAPRRRAASNPAPSRCGPAKSAPKVGARPPFRTAVRAGGYQAKGLASQRKGLHTGPLAPAGAAGGLYGKTMQRKPRPTPAISNSVSSDSSSQGPAAARTSASRPQGARGPALVVKPRIPLKDSVVQCERATQQLQSRVSALEQQQEDTQG
eukprot:CAMPEP_0174366130 /NCGR_PEP_ID=MMETSP0811_2-20130205/79983_1 /TAXON_ID=73025 ORGANISM="Eutreptiella gymnastica-like, Strain CCMP1594" /NCGR_SAMPLE_ID=MMETSP0811_2 /ASSEMBLY_ACC=CAM_ASM_000667 /LENGTH=234 /DNA_ID=CAMNT_0015507401 /DNA_START=17 /DNA_END=718 /DNA_ORIENTATION=+